MITDILSQLLSIYTFVLLARILMSWIPNLDPYNPIVQFLYRVTEPVLDPARKLIPPIGMIDISPIVVFLVIGFIADFLNQLPY